MPSPPASRDASFPSALLDPPKELRFGNDAFLLGAYACRTLESLGGHSGRPPLTAELGCGDGSALFGVLSQWGGLALGIDINQAFTDLAAKNAERLGLSGVSFINMDLRNARASAALKAWAGRASLALANPPWRPPQEGRRCASPMRNAALWAEEDTLKIFCAAASFLLAPRAHFCCISNPGSLPKFIEEMSRAKLGLREILPIAPAAGKPAARVLMRARKGSAPLPKLLPPLILHEPRAQNSKWSEAALRFCPWLSPGSPAP